ncbi:hypothetical protein XaplCFBP3122_04375 [Xanthomonas arboricola pv. populi]|uniref:Sulfatase N-terminal domain-containing protein n=1 Tax=Xanthomonas arboricola pv. populi TaxID=487823 RepID=A0A2S6Z800_9XANT|nr:phosphoethanolamine transferase [Xanthomonas arboricola]PPT77886.1 hypothetical protein XaplCFBP3122_04375 [Xanthomonas arboricola pv. populi]
MFRNFKRERPIACLVFIFLVVVLISPSVYLLFGVDQSAANFGIRDSELITPVILLNILFVLTVVAVCRRAWLAVLVLMPLFLWLPAEIFYLSKYGVPTTAQSFGVISETNLSEALSWLGTSGIWACAACMGWCLLMIVFAVFLYKSDVVWSHWSAKFFASLFPAILLAGWIVQQSATERGENGSNRGGAVWGGVLDESRSDWGEILARSYPLGMFVRIYDYRFQVRLLSLIEKRFKIQKFDAVQNPRAEKRQIFVFVVGESLRPDHLQLNGYARATSPRLLARDVISLKNFVSATPATRTSVPTYFSQQQIGSTLPFQGQSNMLDGFREAGFRTYWLSTQEPFGRFVSPISVIARRADEVKFLNYGGYLARGEYDGAMLMPLRGILEKKEKRAFIVLHTLGAHADYRGRYPESEALFRPVLPASVLSDPWDKDQRVQQINAYDNAVLQIDRFVDQIVKMVEQEGGEGWVFYVSDHGETLFDGACKQSGHGFAASTNYRSAAFFWASSGYRKSHPSKLNYLSNNSLKPTDYRAIMPTLLGLADIDSNRLQKGSGLASSDYSLGSRKVVTEMGVVDFDREMKVLDCAR